MRAAAPDAFTVRPSRAIRRTPLAWDVALDAPDRRGETRLPDFVAFAALAFPALIAPVVGLPVNELAMVGLCVVALTRRPATGHRSPAWLVLGLAGLLGFLVATSVEHDNVNPRRLLHLALFVLLVQLIAAGRVHLPSAARGAAVGLLAAVGLTAAHVGTATGYTGRLSGLIGDPNSGGYLALVVGAVAIGLLPRGPLRLVVLVLIPATVVLTYSRTSLLAFAFCTAWVCVGRRAGPVAGLGLVAAGVWVVGHIPHQLRLFGPFADRVGSDLLRQRIIVQEHLEIARSPWFGAGAGTAQVEVDHNTFFYHSSYLALQREGGLLALAIVIGMIAALAVAQLRSAPDVRNVWLEAAVIGVLVCALNLGEVLLELPTAVALGVLAHHLLATRAARAVPEATPEKGPGSLHLVGEARP